SRRWSGCTGRSPESAVLSIARAARIPGPPSPGRRGSARRSATGLATIFPQRLQVSTLSRPEQRVEVGRRARPEVRGRELVDDSERLDEARDVGGLVALAAIWHRREKRAVRFCQEPIQRNAPHGRAKFLRFRKGDDPGQRDEKAERETGVGQRRT